MERKRHWLGRIAIGVSGLALLVALAGRGFGPQIAAAGLGGANAPQSYAQQGAGRPGSGPQNAQGAPGAGAQQGQAQPGSGPQNGPAARGADMQPGPGRPGDRGFARGGWFGLPLGLLGGSFRIGMLALLVVLGVWLLRRRTASGAYGSGRAEPAQQPPQPETPTGESYTDEPGNPE